MRFLTSFLRISLVLLVSKVSAQDSSGSCDVSGVGRIESSDLCSSHCGSGFLPCFVTDASTDFCNSSTSDSGSDDGCYYQEDSIDGEGSCAYQCSANADTSFIIYIPYASVSFKNYGGGGDGDLVVSESLVNTVGTLEIDSFVWIFKLAGGETGFMDLQGQVVNVSLAGNFLATQTQMTSVTLVNLNLTNLVDDLPGLLAPTTEVLTLDNNLLFEFPWGLGPAIPSLTMLSLDNNYLSTVLASENASYFASLTSLSMKSNDIQSFDAIFPSLEELYLTTNILTQFPAVTQQMSKLKTLSLSSNFIPTVNGSSISNSLENLYMSGNELVAFEGYFPNLLSLDLSNNNLTEIPATVYNCTKLVSLDLSSNPLMLNLTSEQLEFLRGITAIDFGGDGSTSFVTEDCNISSLNGVSVCVYDTDNTNDHSSIEETDENRTGAIIGGVVGGIGALVLIGMAYFYWKRSSTSKHSKNFQALMTSTTGVSASTGLKEDSSKDSSIIVSNEPLDPVLLKLQVDSQDVQDMRLIGVGSGSVCWLVRFRQTELLASKQLRPEQATQANLSLFVHEIKLVASLNHPCIISFVGINSRRSDTGDLLPTGLQALFEYAPNGTLREYLTSPAVPKIWHAEKLQIAADVANALAYLHSRSPLVIHRGVHSDNVLLTGNMRAKLAGFGSATAKQLVVTNQQRWLAPEVMAGNDGSSESADVYSFGVLLLELDTHNLSSESGNGQHSRHQHVARDTPIVFNSTIPSEVKTLTLACLEKDSRKRPSTAEIFNVLSVMKLQD